MKILQVIPFFSPKFGGTISSVASISKELRKRGHDITILTTDFEYDEKFSQVLIDLGIKIEPCPCIKDIGLFTYSPSINNWLQKQLKNFDVIHMHNFRSYQNARVALYAKKLNIPYILQARGSVLPFFEKTILKKSFDFIWGYKILDSASKIIALTEFEKEQYKIMKVPDNKIVIIPNGIDLSLFENLPLFGNFRKEYNISFDKKIVLYLGRIHRIKGLDILIKAFFDIQKENSNVLLVIAGPYDKYQEVLITQINDLKIFDKVIFTGPLYGKKKFDAYVDADVYILPSRYETFPNTILEALACQKPIITTNNCGIAEYLQECGIIVECSDKGLRDATRYVLNNETIARNLAKNGRLLIENHFEQRRVINEIEELYVAIQSSQ